MRLSDVPTGLHEVRVVFPGYSDGRANVEISQRDSEACFGFDSAPATAGRSTRFLAGLAVEAAPAIQLRSQIPPFTQISDFAQGGS